MVSKSGEIETISILILRGNSLQTLHEYCFPNLCRAPFSEKQSPTYFFVSTAISSLLLILTCSCANVSEHLSLLAALHSMFTSFFSLIVDLLNIKFFFPYWPLHLMWRHFIVLPSDLGLADLVAWHLHNIAHFLQHLLVTSPFENCLHLHLQI